MKHTESNSSNPNINQKSIGPKQLPSKAMAESREDISAQAHIDKLTKELDALKEANKELAEKYQVNASFLSLFLGLF